MAYSTFLTRDRVRRKPQYDVANLLGRAIVKGELGIEIEVEGNKFPKEGHSSIPPQWRYTKDGSLRGHDNAEYVLAKPILFDESKKAVTDLWTMFSKYGSILDESNRTSVHVHLNVGQFHLNRLTSFLAMYFSLEEILTEWCGEHRVGNLFCLRAKDAPAIVSHLKQFIKNDGMQEIGNGFHYAGLNANAMFKFGSIEIRSLRGCTDPNQILDWIAVLERMYKMSKDFPDPRTLVDSFSSQGAMAFFEMLTGDRANTIRHNIPFDNGRMIESLLEGIRLAQDLCYCREWKEYEPVVVERDPFGRIRKKTTPLAADFGALEQILIGQTASHPTAQWNALNEVYGTAPTPAPPLFHTLAQATTSAPIPADEWAVFDEAVEAEEVEDEDFWEPDESDEDYDEDEEEVA